MLGKSVGIGACLVAGAVVSACSCVSSVDTSRLYPDAGDASEVFVDVPADAVEDGPPPSCTQDLQCDDGRFCNGVERCVSGQCVPGVPPACTDMFDCTLDACDPAANACTHTPNNAACPPGQICDVSQGCVVRACTSDAACQDGLVCDGMEHCSASGSCVGGTPLNCADRIGCTTDGCSEAAGGCTHTPVDGLCDDGNPCNGRERCDPSSGCVPGTPPDCNDRIDCTIDGCDPMSGGCVHTANDSACVDGNGCTSDFCDLTLGCMNPPRDDDGDGYPVAGAGGRMCPGGTDCNDRNPDVHPGATEICNGIDDNCNGVVDEGCPDPCSLATVIDATGGTYTGTTVGGVNHSNGSCVPAGGPDVIYRLDLAGASDVVIDLEGSSYDTALHVRSGSCTGLEVACNDDHIQGFDIASRLFLHRIPAGTYYVFVDGYGGASGTYTMTVTIGGTPSLYTCAAPLDITGGGTVVAWTGGGISTTGESGSCGGFAMMDEEYQFTLAGPANVQADPTGSGFTLLQYVRSDPCATGTERACTTSGTLNVALTAGTYYLFADDIPTATPTTYWIRFDP